MFLGAEDVSSEDMDNEGSHRLEQRPLERKRIYRVKTGDEDRLELNKERQINYEPNFGERFRYIDNGQLTAQRSDDRDESRLKTSKKSRQRKKPNKRRKKNKKNRERYMNDVSLCIAYYYNDRDKSGVVLRG